MSRAAKLGLLAAIVAAFVIVNLQSANDVRAQVSMPKMSKMATYVLEGNFRVHYDCAFPDNTKKKDKEEQVKKIEFHPQYIVLFGQTGSGRVIPVHAIKELTWEQS